jgi:low affinity Fe/Cu permease
MNDFFRRFARSTADAISTPAAFFIALASVLVWALCGPFFKFSDTWQLVINTGTTIITFLVVFMIQNTQNRDAKAVHLKLDELLRAVKRARTGFVDLERLTDEELDQMADEFHELHEREAARRTAAPHGK